MITQKTTHVEEALDNLLSQFKGKPNIEALISLLASQIQELENAAFQIVEDTTLTAAVGDQLDGWGRIFDQPRNGQVDATYRTFLQAKTRIIRSRGTIEDLIEILDLLTGGTMSIELSEFPDTDPAHFDINITTALPAGTDGVIVARLTLRAKPAGVRGLITFFDSDGIGFDTVGEGFDDADDAFGTIVGE